MKCPACGGEDVHSSRRRSSLEKLSAFFGIAYMRCHACKHRFPVHIGGFASRSMEKKYLLLKQRAKEILIASAILAILVIVMILVIGRLGEGQ